MRIVYAPVDTYNNNHPATAQSRPDYIRVGWTVLLETDEEREFLGEAHLPFSVVKLGISLEPLEIVLANAKRRKAYSALPIEQVRQALVGLDISWLFFDHDMLGFDYRRAEAGGHHGGVTFSFPRLDTTPRIPVTSGRITGVYEDGFVIDGAYHVPLPEYSRINSMSEPEGQPLLIIAD